MKKGFSPSEAISYGWETFKKNVWMFVLLTVLSFAVSSISNIFSGEDANIYLVVIAQIVGFVLSILVSVGITKIALRVYDGEKARLGEVFNYSRYGVRFFVVSLLMMLIIVLGLGTPLISGIIWAIKNGKEEVKKNGWYFFALLLAPWLVWIIQFSFAQYFIVDKDARIVESLVKSSSLTKQVKLDLIAFGLLQMLVMLIGVLCLFIGLFAAVPVLWLSEVFVYRKLLEQTKFEKKAEAVSAEPAAA